MTHIFESFELNLILTALSVLLAAITVPLFYRASGGVAGELGRGTNLIAIGVIAMALNFMFGLADHMHLSGIETPLAHPGWVHGATIILALLLFIWGALIISRTSVKVTEQ